MVRREWLDLMLKIAHPVLASYSSPDGNMQGLMSDDNPERSHYRCLEAVCRTLTGIAPWLELEGLTGEERALQEKYRELARLCMYGLLYPKRQGHAGFSPEHGQTLVEAGFLSLAIVRAPSVLDTKWADPAMKASLVNALRSTRKFEPYPTNWLLFSAMVEAAFLVMGEEYDLSPVERAVNAFEKWYLGDGTYGDGKFFHFDYYNSFVIHPMYEAVLETFAPVVPKYAALLPIVKRRAARYAGILERLIAPDGSYPITGRSICYRFGAFHALANAALKDNLPEGLSPAQVRCALSAVIKKTASGGMFDKNGFLKTGVYGSQTGLAEHYINSGSLYLCMAAFLPLGLSPAHPFWSGADAAWTSKKIWAGEDLPCDKAED